MRVRDLGALALCVLAGCQVDRDVPPEAPPAKTKIEVAVASFPVAYLVQRIGGDDVVLKNLLPPGEDPPSWQPTGEVVAEIAGADLIVLNGAGFEAFTSTASLPRGRVVDTSRGFDFIVLKGETHSHGAQAEHSHAGKDPHVWSDPDLYYKQAEVVRRALASASPSHADHFEANLGALRLDLADLSRGLASAIKPAEGIRLAASHPAFNYLARRYGMELRSFDFDPEQLPSEPQLAAFVEWMGVSTSAVLLWEAQPADEVRGAFPAGVSHVYIDPLEQPGPSGGYDYLSQARKNTERFGRLFSNGSP